MSLLKGNYNTEEEILPSEEKGSSDELLEQEYYKAALAKLGGSIAFIMKDKNFLWAGDDEQPSNQPKDTIED